MTIIFITLAFLNILFIINLKNLSGLINIYDYPDKKIKLHKKKTPILGGLIFFINFTILTIYQIFFLNEFLSFKIDSLKLRDVVGIIVLISTFFLIGLYDDKYNLSPLKKIILSIIFIIVSISLNQELKISNFLLSFYPNKIFLENFSMVFSIFCFLILMNSLNFFDGINGQSLIYFLFIFTYLFFNSEMNLFYIINILILLILLILNLKNKIFLGDSGIFLISAIISVCLIYEYNLNESIRYADEIFFLLLLPGFDLIRLTLIRILNGQNAFSGDRNHIHHLINKKLSIFYTNLILILLAITPVILFSYIEMNFQIVLTIFIILYSSLILIFKSYDTKYHNRKK